MTPRLATCDHIDADSLTAAMTVMDAAFDPGFGEAWTIDQLAGMLDLPGSWMTVAHDPVTAVPLGFSLSRATFDEAELLLIAVMPDTRRQGIARRLLDGFISTANSRGVCKVHLEVRNGNPAALLYANAGFIEVGRRRDYYRGRSGEIFDALTFSRSV